MPSNRRTVSNLPRTTSGLRAWLRDTDEGRRIVSEVAARDLEEKCRACEMRQPFPKVLVVLRRLERFAGVEVYAEEGVLTRLLEMPDVPDDGQFGLEEWIELNLPKNWKHMIGLPERRIHRDVFRGIRLERVIQGQIEMELIEEMHGRV